MGLLTYNCKICAVSATEFVVIEQQQKTNTPYKYRHLDKFHFYAIFIKEEKERYTGFKLVYAMLMDFFFLMPTNFWEFLVCFCILAALRGIADLKIPQPGIEFWLLQ